MQRLLAEVRHKRLKKRYRDRNGLEYVRYALRAKVEGSAVDALSVPKRVVGREISLTRDFLLPWGVRKGDLLVLDPDESARVLCPRRAQVREGCTGSGRVVVESGDVNRDGHSEDVFANCFVRAIVEPHRGARLRSLTGRSGSDRFAQPYDYVMGGKYILLGGAEAVILESGSPGELWKAAFGREERDPGDGAVERAYTHALKSPEGVKLEKTVRLERDFPGVLETYRVSYSGKPKAEGEKDGTGESGEKAASGPGDAKAKKDDTTEITFCVRVSTAVLGDVGSRNVFDVPESGNLKLVRYHRPGSGRRWRWRDWRDEYFGLGPGFLVSRHEKLGNVLVALMSPRKTGLVSIRRDYQGPELLVRHVPRKLRKGRRVEFGMGFLVGDAVRASADSMLLLTKGKRGRDGIPVAFTLRTARRIDRVWASVSTSAGRRTFTLAQRELPGAGCVYMKVVHFPGASFPLTCTVTAGKERLSCSLEA